MLRTDPGGSPSLATLDDPHLAPADRFDRVVRLARELFEVPVAYVAEFDRAQDRLTYRAESGLDLTESTAQRSFCAMTVEQGSMLVVPDASQDERFATSPWVVRAPGIRFYAGVPLRNPDGDRVATLCVVDHRPRTFDARQQALLQDLAGWVEKELAADGELRRAGDVQAGLLPRSAPAVPGYGIAGACVPARVVGGDFYDWHTGPRGLALTLADVMGKGMSAAIIAASVRATLRASTRRLDAAAALLDAEESLEGDLQEAATFATAFHATLDVGTGVVTYADAGHGLSLVIRDGGGHERLPSGGPPIGFGALGERTVGEVSLGPGDLLISVSDGVLDAFDGTLGTLDYVRAAVTGAGSAQEVVDRVVGMTRRSAPLPDDVTVVALRRDL